MEYRALGEVRLFHNIVTPLRIGRRIVGIIGFLIDLTERKHAEESLRTSEEQLRMALDASSAGTWAWDVARNVATWDERYQALYGFGPDDPVSHESWLGRVHPEDRESLQARIRDLLEPGAGTTWNEEFRALHPVLGERWM